LRMVIKRDRTWFVTTMPLLLFSIFSFTRGSIGLAIPAIGWFGIMFIILLISAVCIIKRRYLHLNVSLCFICYTLIMIFLNRNQDFVNGVFAEALYYATALLLCIALVEHFLWHETLIKLLIYVGLFYSVWTIASALRPTVYSDFILPWLRLYEPGSPRGNYMNGFTTHYSINGMYLALGIMAGLSYINTEHIQKKSSPKSWLQFLIVAVGLLLCGKRGIVISVVLAYSLTYLASARERGRLFKLTAIFSVALFVIYLASFWFEPILSILNRFTQQIQKGDIASGRFEIWSEALTAFWESPVFGKGWGWFRYNNSFGAAFHAHNCYLQWLCELGIFFTVPLLVLIGVCYYNSFRLLRKTMVEMDREKIRQNPTVCMMAHFSFLYQSYFLIFIFEGTGFYEVQSYFVYFLTIIIVEFYRNYLRKEKLLAR